MASSDSPTGRFFALSVAIALTWAAAPANADFAFGEPTNLGPNINSTTWDGGAAVSPDELELYFYSFFEGFGIPTVRVAVRQSDQDPWAKARSASWLPFSGTSMCFSADGLTLLYESLQAGGFGQTDIWMTTRVTLSDPWGPTVNLGSGVNSPYTDMGASLSPDGLELYFGSDRPGGSGDWDVYVSTRETAADPWGPATNLGPTINSSVYDGHPYIAPDGLTLFVTSARPGGYGDWDIWFTRRRDKESAWPPLVNAGPALNTSVDDVDPYISFDGQTLYFSDGYSFRSGGVGGTDLWQVPILPIVDFNGDGMVNGEDVLIMAAHWGQDYSPCDVGPTPLGDGIVDLQDVIALAEYIGKEVTDPTLLAHWPLDEAEGSVARDSAGDRDGTVVGSPAWQPAGGSVNGALEFDGTTVVVTEFVLDPDSGPFSVFAWIKGGAPGQVVVSQTPGIGFGSTWLGVDAVEGKLMTGLMAPLPALVSDSVIADDLWHRIGLVWDGSRRYLYVDEREVAGDPLDVWGIPSDGDLCIGCGRNLESGSHWSGLIDDVRIYNRAVRP